MAPDQELPDFRRPHLFLLREPPPAPMALAYARAADGSLFWPAFSDINALLRWNPEGGATAEAPLVVMRKVMADSGIHTLIVDPGSPNQRVLHLGDLPTR